MARRVLAAAAVCLCAIGADDAAAQRADASAAILSADRRFNESVARRLDRRALTPGLTLLALRRTIQPLPGEG